MSLPDSHPPVSQDAAACPVTGQKYAFTPPQEDDIRSACPALNTMANHGYIARNGKNLSATDVARGLMSCYGLSTPCAMFLSYTGFLVLGKFGRRINLYEIGKHGRVEHDASLVHHDTPEGQDFAPIEIDHSLVDALISDVKPSLPEITAGPDPTAKFLMNYEDVARARVRREKQCKPLDGAHAEIARGEMAIILGVWEVKTKDKVGIPVDYIKRWIGEERLPDGWKPDHTQGLFNVIKRSIEIRSAMDKMKKDSQEAKEPEKLASPTA
ncbi:Cloroperoxidase [Phlegmacium glaucopus]|nr:Cloroperoxidase [Phlegmacium glaucopus]